MAYSTFSDDAADDRRRARPIGRPPFHFDPPPPQVDARLRGSGDILRRLPDLFPDRDVPPGALVTLVLSRQSMLVAQARVRVDQGSLDVLPTSERGRLLAGLLHDLRTSHPRGALAFACLLVVLREGDTRLADTDVRWWTALRAATVSTGLHAADVLVSTPRGWLTVRAGTRGPEGWPQAGRRRAPPR